MFKSVRHCSQQFSLPESKIRPFEKILIIYETQLLSGVIFQVKSHVHFKAISFAQCYTMCCYVIVLNVLCAYKYFTVFL